MNLEESIKDMIGKKLVDGTIEGLIEKQFTKGMEGVLSDLFSYGDVTKVIKDKIKSVMIPFLENYDYSKYIVKLDNVLVDVLKNTALDNKKLLENFKDLMTNEDKLEEITVTDLFEQWTKYISKNVDTSELEIDYDDGVSYEYLDARFEVEYKEERSWSSSSFEYATLVFECEQDEKMNFEIGLSRWKEDKKKSWSIRYDANHDLPSLRHLNKFEILLMKLNQNYTKLIIDKDYDNDEVEVEAEPEATFS